MANGAIAEIVNWLVLAIGAALLLGTGAALLAYRRTGVFPGQSASDARSARSSVRTAVAKCVVGGLLMLWGLGGLATLR
ncbi:MAG: hypothetical protein ACRDYX_05125 [Egibacteraceae bacterium]